MKNSRGHFFYIAVILLLAASAISAQDVSRLPVLKLYSNFSFEFIDGKQLYDPILRIPVMQEKDKFNLGYFSPAVGFYADNGNYHEIEFSKLIIDRTDITSYDLTDSIGQPDHTRASSLRTNITVGLRYEYNYIIIKNPDSKFQPSIGFGVNPYYTLYNYKPKVSLSYPVKEHTIGAMVQILPRIIYNISERWFLDLNIPINLSDFYYTNNNTGNPTLPIAERNTGTINLDVFPGKYLFRFGAGCRL